MEYEKKIDINGKSYLRVNLTDFALITTPLLNKGMAFTEEERHEFKLIGIIPPHQATLNEQVQRSYLAFKNKPTPIEKYLYLRDLQDSNETLFYRLLYEHLAELMPIVYTPTVGLACQMFSEIYRRPRGIFVAYPHKAYIEEILNNARFEHVEVIVVSDGERILGLGDQGAGGMGIPIGKLNLYTACAGLHPSTTLPILLDVGTDNERLLKNPLYIGWRHKRIRGQDYDDFVDAFIQAVKKRFPNILLQWEDFAQHNATQLLKRYQDHICSFNDDIQGTAAVVVAALLTAIKGVQADFSEQKIIIVGAGSAGCGIAKLLISAMITKGVSLSQARLNLYLVDKNGLLIEEMPDIQPFQQDFLQPRSNLSNWKYQNKNFISLQEVVENVHPTILIGVCGQAGIFNEMLVKTMAKYVKNPIIFPLSNPITRCEGIPQDLFKWTDYRAIIGTGSPFDAVKKDNKIFQVAQINNSYIFPALGLGLVSVKAKKITEKIFMAAAQALANFAEVEVNEVKNDIANIKLLPSLGQMREIAFHIAMEVSKEAINLGLADECSHEDLVSKIQAKMWVPDYLPYRKS